MAGDGGDPGLVCVGVVSGARGIKGDVRIKSFTRDPEAIASYGDLFDEKGETRYSIRIVGHRTGGQPASFFSSSAGASSAAAS